MGCCTSTEEKSPTIIETHTHTLVPATTSPTAKLSTQPAAAKPAAAELAATAAELAVATAEPTAAEPTTSTKPAAADPVARAEPVPPPPPHGDLLLGLTLPVLREQIGSLPGDAVTIARQRKPKHEELGVQGLDGYANQEIIRMRSEAEGGGRSVCQELSRAGTPGVGRATHYLSRWLGTPLEDVLTALAAYEAAHPEQAPIYWWVCDFSISQNEPSLPSSDDPLEERLAAIIATVGHTVMLLDPWDAPATLGRLWCLWEVWQTQETDASFDVAMSEAQGQRFLRTLKKDYNAIALAMGRIDVRTADAIDARDKARILAEVEASVGAWELSRRVSELVSAALAQCGRATLEKWSAEGRGNLGLLSKLGRLLQEQGDLEGAAPLYRQAVAEKRERLGGRHPKTLSAISDLGTLLQARGDLEGAAVLLREALDARCASLGGDHPDTLTSIDNLGALLQEQGDLECAEALFAEVLGLRRETLGCCHRETHTSIFNLGMLLHERGRASEALPLLREARDLWAEVEGQEPPEGLLETIAELEKEVSAAAERAVKGNKARRARV